MKGKTESKLVAADLPLYQCGPNESGTSRLESGVYIQRNARNVRNVTERNEMTSLSDRPITAASDDGVCRCWHAAKLWQTRAKLSKLNLICVMNRTTSKKPTKIWTIDFLLNFQS